MYCVTQTKQKNHLWKEPLFLLNRVFFIICVCTWSSAVQTHQPSCHVCYVKILYLKLCRLIRVTHKDVVSCSLWWHHQSGKWTWAFFAFQSARKLKFPPRRHVSKYIICFLIFYITSMFIHARAKYNNYACALCAIQTVITLFLFLPVSCHSLNAGCDWIAFTMCLNASWHGWMMKKLHWN